jgi:predicted lysophospholipase L1 biosynthesis ABC-type transport system permease subunit
MRRHLTAARSALAEARRGLAPRRRRALLTGLGIALSAAMLSAAVVVADGLGLGFDRAAKAADLPDLIVRFNPQSESEVDQRIRALPDVAHFATRTELTDTGVNAAGAGRRRYDAVAEVVGGGTHRGYAVVQGRDLRPTGNEVLLEKGFADAWGLRPGSTMTVRGLGRERVVGLVEAPDNVAFPLAKPRYYLARSALDARFGVQRAPKVDYAEIWARDPAHLEEMLVQARATSFGLRDLRFATRSGVHVLLDQAAGIVIDLLVALSLLALATAGAMLAASARAEVQRRLPAIGVQRAVGASGGHVTLIHALEAALVAAPAAAIGCLAGVLAIAGPSAHLLTLLNEPAPGTALIAPVAASWVLATALAVGGAAWPAWRAAARPVVALLRGADVARTTRTAGTSRTARSADRRSLRSSLRLPAGLTVLGARLVSARRARLAATVITLGLSAGFVLLMLSLASELSALQTDPSALGRRYQLTAALPPSDAGKVARIAGVADVAPRYDVRAVDSFSLGETIDVIAYPGDHSTFEAPPLTAGRRLRGSGQAEIGQGLAQALGLSPGQTLALQLSTGKELRLRIAGVVSSLDDDGRVAYVPAAALLRDQPTAGSQLAIRLTPNANTAAVRHALAALGTAPATAAGATAQGAPLVAVLEAIVRAVAVVDGLVCLYALLQACALTMQERRRTIAVLRACGAGAGAVRRLLAGAALCMLVPAAIAGVLLERFVLGPALSRLAENYAELPLRASGTEVGLTVLGLLAAAAVAVLWVARQAARESVVVGLRG